MHLKKSQRSNIIMLLLVVIASIYVGLFSVELSTDMLQMNLLYVIMAGLLLFLKSDDLLYVLFFFLPMRKMVYFGDFAFFNVILIIFLVKSLLKRNRKLPWIELVCALILCTYDILISMLSYHHYSITAYMIKWYFSFFVFLYMLSVIPLQYNYKKGTLALNLGLLIVGVLTISQYVSYEVITGGVREFLAGAGGTLDQNTYSFFCLMGATSGFAYTLDRKYKNEKKIFNIIIIALSLFNFMCGMYMVSKGFYVVVAIVSMILAISMIKEIVKYFKYIIVIVAGLVYAFSLPTIQLLINSIILRFTGATDINSLTTGRSDLYVYYIDAISSEPIHSIFGAGLSTYRLHYNAHNNYITHNTTLELWAAWGIIGVVFIIGIILFLCKTKVFKNRRWTIYSLVPLISLLLFSQTVSMFWEDASLFFLIFTLYFAIHLVPESNDDTINQIEEIS